MIQKNIRDYNNQEYSKEEGAEIIKELDDRTKSSLEGYNSIGEVGAKTKELTESFEVLNTEGIKSYQNKIDLPDATALADGVAAKVVNDAATTNNGHYAVVANSWVKDADLVENLIEASNTSKGVSGKAVFNHVISKDSIFKKDLALLPAFSDGQNLHLGNFIKDLKLTFSSDYNPKKTDSTFKRLHVVTINHLNATQVYISWKIERNDGSFYSISSTPYYVTKGADISNIVGSYIATIPSEGSITFDFVFDFSTIAEGVFSFNADLTNAEISEEILLKSFTDYNSNYELSKVTNLTSLLKSNNDEILDNGKNLFDKSLPVIAAYLDASGNEVAHATAKISPYISIFPSLQYTYQNYYGASTKFCTYDKDKNFLASYPSAATGNPADGTFTAIKNEFYVRFSVRDINDFMVEEGATQSPYELFKKSVKRKLVNGLSALNVVAFGDSITEISGNWTERFKQITGITDLTNNGLSGQKISWRAGTVETTTITTGGNDNNVLWNAIKKWEATTPTAPNAIIIAEGTNDISQNSPLGTYADAFAQDEPSTSQQTMAGALRKALQYLILNYPNTQIFYMTPLQSKTGGRSFTNLKLVSDINVEICEHLNVKVIDCFKLSGIIDENEGVGVAGRYLSDGTHPNVAGGIMQGKCVAKVFEETYYFE